MKLRSLVSAAALLAVAAPATARAQSEGPHVHLAFLEPAPEGDPCDGYTYRFDTVGDRLGLLACVHDPAHAIVDTTASELYLEWDIPAEIRPEPDPPPTETGADGRAALEIDLLDGGRYNIAVRLCSGTPCEVVSSAFVEVMVEGSVPACVLNGTDCDGAVLGRFESRHLFIAVGSPITKCMEGRPVLLKREKPGRDEIVVMKQTRSDGGGSIPIRKTWDGRFYIVAPPWQVTTTEGPVTCERERSRSLRIRHGFR